MLTVMIVGLAMGATVLLDNPLAVTIRKKAARGIGNTVTLFMAVSVVLTVILVLLVKPITAIMSTPTDAVSGTLDYLTICFIGIPFITAYNVISAIFRGMGDSKALCILLLLRARLILDLIISLWVYFTSDLPEQLSVQPFLKQSALSYLLR